MDALPGAGGHSYVSSAAPAHHACVKVAWGKHADRLVAVCGISGTCAGMNLEDTRCRVHGTVGLRQAACRLPHRLPTCRLATHIQHAPRRTRGQVMPYS